MTETATSPIRTHTTTTSRAPRPTTTPSARAPSATSVGQKMPPQLSTPRITSPRSQIPSVKTPSPNYFGFQTDGSSFLTGDSPQHTKANWSPPSSAIRSTAAGSPYNVPLDHNPDFEAFRRQSEGKTFSFGSMSMAPTPTSSTKSRHGKSSSRSEVSKEVLQPSQSRTLEASSAEMLGRSPKRVLSPGSLLSPEEERRVSAGITQLPARYSRDGNAESQPRFALPLDLPQMSGPVVTKTRSEPIASSKNDTEVTQMVTPQHVVELMDSKAEQILLLDLRVSTQYAKSHIAGALSLCIPTTLLKRPSFNVQKLAETFKDEEQRRQFEQWRESSHIVVYDASSSLLKDATICVNTVKKFRSEGYEGTLYILKGGMQDFAKRFPAYSQQGVDASKAQDVSKAGVEDEGPKIAPVVGGCPMPATDQPANPFFGNIRQNMDLIGGVGQIPLKHPSKSSKSAEREFPAWLRQVADERDQGKRAAGKFEQIERREKKRMEDALSGHVSYGSPRRQTPTSARSTQLAGIEKGNKNRYKDILPFEHSRVKLRATSSSDCDYFNGSYIKASGSGKRYISTQAPMPGTFADFWNVVWQHDIRVVVMLTAEKEGAQTKAHNYWDRRHYGPLQLDFLSEKRASIDPSRINRHRQRPSAPKRSSTSNPQIPLAQLDSNASASEDAKDEGDPYIIVRRFTLRHDHHPYESLREITQLQYSTWPDFGAPAHPAHLLGLVEQCDAVVRYTERSSSGSGDSEAQEGENKERRPVLVHCSAGCGRTGTFCTVDSVIDILKQQRKKSDAAREVHRERERDPTPMNIDQGSTATTFTTSKGDDGFFAKSASSQGTDSQDAELDAVDLVEKTVEDFRLQRISMVQSLRQFVLCYESVMEWLVEQQQGQKGS